MPEADSSQFSPVEMELDSTLESVDRAESEVLRAAQGCGIQEDEQHRFGMAVRESVVNAVVHGNRYNSRKKVHLRIARGRERLEVEIADEGEGFNPDSVPNPLADENLLRQSGRGILLIQAFVDEFHVKRGRDSGTVVRLVKYLGRQA